MKEDLIYQLALTRVPNIGYVQARTLAQHFGNARDIFKANKNTLERIEGIGQIRAGSIKSFSEFKEQEKEIAFIQKFNIHPLFITDPEFPQRLLNCYDAPALLFYKGKADLNASRIAAIVGTRSNTEYGKQFTEKLVRDLAASEVIITSGLAFGIDGIAHRAAIKNNLPTIGVVGHGLDQIYPSEHSALAKEMVKEGGGILTEFRSNTKPEKHNFPGRNRIVAGISDVTILVETGIKGGSMITAEIANSYNRDVFAVPGRSIDTKSAGCNHLIRTNKAVLLSDGIELIELMGWREKNIPQNKQRKLFVQLNEHEQLLVNILKEKELVHIDELNIKSGLSRSLVAAGLLNLELQSVIVSLPGSVYRLA